MKKGSDGVLTKEEMVKLLNDIDEIQDVLNRVNAGYPLDRRKAEDIIRKHNQTDPVVAASNFAPNSVYVTFEQATDSMYLDKLKSIRDYLSGKLIGKAQSEYCE